MSIRVLTGVTTSGTPHLGNYVGAIRPAIRAAGAPGTESFYFLADLHSLIKVQDPERTQRSTLEIAATWLACGLDPEKVWLYRQSDVPEITELMWLLTCVAGKGILNRAHAYKAVVDKNRSHGDDDDAGITAGLFMYPVLMAADILLFNAHQVPVGRDQIQHIEMARDFAQRFNHIYGGEYLVLPEAAIDEQVATLPGLDGRKMSKSYGNTMPLFCTREELKKYVFSIVTDSRAPGEPKDAVGSAVFQLYQAFAGVEECSMFAQALVEGLGWGEAKVRLFERIDAEVAPLRERYEDFMRRPADIEAMLCDSAGRLRERDAIPLLARLREAVGLRSLSLCMVSAVPVPQEKVALPVLKQYREQDGRFYFKLIDGQGAVLVQSRGFASPRDAGQWIALFKQAVSAEALVSAMLEPVADPVVVLAALRRLREAGLDLYT
ncbi:tryptophan--tRNA ligase [Xylella fastidiosa]|uniref:tryptophan--tRNA ligase n=1 Tax=Xylella fastidiosa TaxID=2371 RepID=UPI0007078E22|nr:tryptophan--tRNA ligase [Xylella fastidiosa]KQH74399.1 tryptophan--tRNA ligase [Xylella fastidiosa]WNY18678.1 tryptophan--tRNA ligase [Xylella fastidiosa]WNY20965.1 tryptophan--tRNA ligase [Xylella fastidiosa]